MATQKYSVLSLSKKTKLFIVFPGSLLLRIGGVEELSFHSGEVSYGLKAIKKLVKEWSDSRKFGLVKLVQNTFYRVLS